MYKIDLWHVPTNHYVTLHHTKTFRRRKIEAKRDHLARVLKEWYVIIRTG